MMDNTTSEPRVKTNSQGRSSKCWLSFCCHRRSTKTIKVINDHKSMLRKQSSENVNQIKLNSNYYHCRRRRRRSATLTLEPTILGSSLIIANCKNIINNNRPFRELKRTTSVPIMVNVRLKIVSPFK